MNTKSFGALAACAATLAVLLCGLTAVLELPAAIEIVMIVVAVVLIGAAGGLIGVAVARQRKLKA